MKRKYDFLKSGETVACKNATVIVDKDGNVTGMKTYANAEDKAVALTVAAMETWISKYLADPPKCFAAPAIKRRLQQMLKHLEALTIAAVSDLDDDARVALHKHISTQDVLIVPKDKVKSSPMYVVAGAEDFEYLVSRIDDCYTCIKSAAEVKGCKIRKAMLNCGAIPTGTGRSECPFQP